MELNSLVRNNILNLKPYSCARDEFKGEAKVLLDANESPYNAPFNRYPDPMQTKVKELISKAKGIESNRIFLGVGSDECIDIIYRVFCNPTIDNAVSITPSYGMYEVCANINDVEYRTVALNADFSLPCDKLAKACDENTKIMWICSPNNPTGNAFPIEEIAKLHDLFNGILVVDEAYIDFSSQKTMLRQLDKLPRLIVMQTFSKAWESAAVRLGMAFANTEIIALFNKVKYPYNINLLTQNYIVERLTNEAESTKRHIEEILLNRGILIDSLKGIRCVKQVFPTDANFVLVRTVDANGIYAYLCSNGVIVRNRSRVQLCADCLRITVGTAEENNELINLLKQYGQ